MKETSVEEFRRMAGTVGDAKRQPSDEPNSYRATLPYPPQSNHLYTVVRGRKVLSSKGRAYRKQIEAYRPVIGPFTGRIKLTIYAYMPDNRKRDLSNILKSLEDAMTSAGFWNDDSQIDDLRIVRTGVESPGRVEVYIQTIGAKK